MSSIDEIKARIDIVDLVSETVQLRRSGKNYTGFCPFHTNTRTPAFVVFPESGTWRCFGQCNEGGDIFGFVMKKEGWDFAEALQRLAEQAGVELKPLAPQEQETAEEHEKLRTLLEEAANFFRHQLFHTQPGSAALDYLHGRGLKDDTVEAFELGYGPNSWDALTQYFKSKGYNDQTLLDGGLVSERNPEKSGGRSGIYDRFRHRVMFPIRDERGRMTGFGARILDPEDVPKFLNSPQTVLFDKGRLLYGLDRARKAVRAEDQVVIVEGYLDVIALHQAGFNNAVSPMGTALSEHHLYLLKRFTRNMILALDPDEAGDKATLRGLQIVRQTLDRELDPVFDARGLLRNEARLQADIRVTTLPPGMDPDDVVNQDPEAWRQIIRKAKPVVEHVMETLAANKDLEDPKIKTQVAAQVLPLIEDVASPIERDTYRQKLARLLRVDERALIGEPVVSPRRRPRPAAGERLKAAELQPGKAPLAPAPAGSLLEAYCLSVLMRRPDLLYRIDRELQKAGLARLALDDFQRSDFQTILKLLQESVDQDDVEPITYVMNHLSLPLMDLADELLAKTEKMDPNEEKVIEDLLVRLVDLRGQRLHQALDHIRFLMEDAQEQGDLLATEYRQNMKQYILTKKLLDQARGQYIKLSLPQG